MSVVDSVKDNWRVGLLILVLLGSTVFLFAPGFAPQAPVGGEGQAADRPTNLKYGLQLSGGARVRAPPVGITAEEVQFGQTPVSEVEAAVAANIEGVDATDVIARRTTQTQGTVEVVTENVTQTELGTALQEAGYEYATIRDGVTEATRQEIVRVLESKINEAGLSGGTVRVSTTAGGEHFIIVEVPGQDRQSVIDLVNRRGTVRITAYHQVNGSYVNTTVLTQGDFKRIGSAKEAQSGPGAYVPVAVEDSEAERVQRLFVETGVAQQGGSQCTFPSNSTEPCILVIRDGRVVSSFGMTPSLAQSMRQGEWAKDPAFRLSTQNLSEAQQVAVDLRAGALPAPLDVGEGGEGTSSYISPAQGERFKTDSLLIGLVAVLTVSAVVFFRYGEAEVALPMIVTAMAEVYVLLGIAALIKYPLDLSVIAGFIAVIGTGVDDLVIIADEVMSEGDVNSRRVFQSRFRKAFWVIGAAAATTIVAMSPLAVLSLGDLQGFAIFTILGVLVGVLITRPAYGDILRALLTDR
ncbi:preprotein translocase subunit SecD [Halobaculum sp. D14]|uniref:preprotein translocase subunit SecD n=1 Tax=unclassified Halobaculum TaxID=2640896 RepID=UPI003EBDD90A